MNHSVDRTALSISPRVAVNPKRRSAAWPVLTAMLALPLLKFGLAYHTPNMLLSGVVLGFAYALGIYLYNGTARLGYERRVALPLVVAVGAGIIGGAVCPAEQLLAMTIEGGIIVLAGLLVGWRAREDRSGLRLYSWGLAVVIGGGLLLFVPQWSDLMKLATESSRSFAADLKSNLVAAGYHADAAQVHAEQALRMMDVTIRLLPAVTVMNLVVQFSVGFLWFLGRGIPAGATSSGLRSFTLWKVPFAVTPVLIMAILARLFGGEMLELAADNLLVALSVFYCVTGLSLAEHFLCKLRVALGIKILFYVMLTLTGLMAYLVMVLLGFVDSFTDWRRVSRQEA